MKRTLFYLTILVILSSCSKFIDEEQIYVSYGNIGLDGSTWFIHTDYGNRLNITNDESVDFVFSEGTRVIAYYEVEGIPVDTTYNIWLRSIMKVLTKSPVSLSLLTPEQIEDIGDDPVNLIEAWYGRGYLNINFELFRNEPTISHFINLVFDDTESNDEQLVFELRHNAYNDLASIYSFGRASFDISTLLPEDITEIEVVIKWVDYYLVERSVTGTLDLSDQDNEEEEPEVKGESWNGNITLETSLYD